MAQTIRLTNDIGFLERAMQPASPVNEPYLEYMRESLISNYQTLINMGIESANHESYAPIPESGLYNNLIRELLTNFSTFWTPSDNI